MPDRFYRYHMQVLIFTLGKLYGQEVLLKTSVIVLSYAFLTYQIS